jgi:arginyl-tRNA synthetase
MIQVKQDLSAALQVALQAVVTDLAAASGSSGAGGVIAPAAAFESPKQSSHGDLAITAAMPLAKSLKRNPRELAGLLVNALNAQPAVQRWVQSLEIAGPGFINLRLAPAAKQAVVAEVLAQRDRFGRQAPNGQRVMVEFVSANPTGPLHVGHARQAALGDAICSLFQTQGRDVTREFYYNDAGVQIATLARSTQLRIQGHKPGDAVWPTDAENPESKKFYNGDYIQDIADAFLRCETVTADDRAFTASGQAEDLDSIRQFAVAYLRHEQDLDLQVFGLTFDNYFLESSVYANGALEAVVHRMVANGKTYEKDGALWFRSTDYGDDQDRVMRKSGDGSYTYFVPDVAYHVNKFERGFRQVINVQGSDHHGTIARVRGGLQAVGMGIPAGYPDYVLHKMVTVMKGGEEVKISKRAGSYVTLRDLVEWTSRDAVRFFLISRKADTEFVFDIDVALKANDENPVFYVQYAHARICSVLARHGVDKPGSPDHAAADLSSLVAPTEVALMLKLADYPDMLTRAAADLAPHDVAFYLRDLASAFHSYYAAERFLVDDPALARARMALLAATAQVLRNALGVLGVSAPEAMAREALPADGLAAATEVSA